MAAHDRPAPTSRINTCREGRTTRTDMPDDIEELLNTLRRDVICMAEKSGHVACALSCVEILAAAYFSSLRLGPEDLFDEARDRFILSKGHAAMALYAVLARAGFFEPTMLERYCDREYCLAEHPIPGGLPGVELATGSLGHGLAFGTGLARGLAMQSLPSRVFVLLGDGECDEGAVWEAAALARGLELDNLTALVDWNGQQACGTCREISKGLFLPAMWAGFGWDVEEVDGHDFSALKDVYVRPNETGRPRVILCRTIKGCGVDFMERDLEWHYRPVRGEDRQKALKGLKNA
jgi:transketolase